MDDSHLSQELLWGLTNGGRNPGELFSIVISHLFEVCPVCESEFRAFKNDLGRTRDPGYDSTFARVASSLPSLRRKSTEVQEQAKTDLAILLQEDRSKRLSRLLNLPRRRRGPALAAGLIEAALSCLPGHPEDCLSHGRLARTVLNHCETSELTIELYAQCLACIAAGRRIGGDLLAAADLFACARFLLRTGGVVSRRTRSLLDWFEGILLRDQRRFKEATRLLRRAATSFAMAGSEPQAAKAFISLALAHIDAKEFPAAVSAIEDAVSFQAGNPEPPTMMRAQHALALGLCDSGYPDVAEGVFRANVVLYQQHCDPLGLLRVSWLEGRIARGMGSAAKAEVCMRRAYEGFRSKRFAFDTALVGLDLAALFLEQGRKFEAKAAANEAAGVLDLLQVPQAAREAVRLCQEADRLG